MGQDGSRTRRAAMAMAVAAVMVGVLAVPILLRSGTAEAQELTKFDDCAGMRTYLQESAAASGQAGAGSEVYAQRGDRATTGAAPPEAATAPETAAAAQAASDSATGTGAGADTGATNVQVEGVDELDVTDTDGKLMVTVNDTAIKPNQRVEVDRRTPTGTLRLIDPAAGRVLATETVAGSSHQLTWDAQGGVVWVVSQGTVSDQTGGLVSRVTRVRAGEGTLTVDGSSEVRGSLVGTRRVGSRLHLVASDGGTVVSPVAESQAGVTPRLPFEGGDVTVPCGEVWHPVAPSQPTAVLVASFDSGDDVEGGKLSAEAVEIAGAGSMLYGTKDALFVATTLWLQDGTTTSIHRFALDGLRWTGSGRVPGVPLNQFAFDEHDGILRVATTVDRSQPVPLVVEESEGGVSEGGSGQSGGGQNSSGQNTGDIASDVAIAPAPPLQPEVDNLVLTLDTDGGLDELGRISGLGKPGERIRGVRFTGDTGYVVTFRQTDPFYVVDLSDPRQPKLAGELELPGFSAYLHPLGDGLVVGIGQAGNEAGQLLGAQAQLFDVSDPTKPRLVDQEPLGDQSPAADDHLAFTTLGDNDFAVPVVSYARDLPVAIPSPVAGVASAGADEVAPTEPSGKPSAGSTSAEPPVTIEPAPPVTIEPEPPVTIEPEPPVSILPVPVLVPQPATVVRIRASAGGLERTTQYVVEFPSRADAYVSSYPMRTVPVAGRIAVLSGSYGVALFEEGGASAGWVLFE